MQESALATSPARVMSIDIVRALNMILMIFVNDLWSLTNIPAWLGHVEFGVDGMGLADVVFPAFLFIVGLSLPYGLEARRKKGDSTSQLVKHVITRAIALLVMGVFLVNGETINADATGMSRYVYYSLACLSFILIWNSYSKNISKTVVMLLKAVGVVVLLVLAFLYRGGEDGNIQYFAPQWWGILGLIGWAYLVSGLVAIFARDNFFALGGSWLLFAMLSVFSKAGYTPAWISFIPPAISAGTLTGLTLGGVLTSAIFRYYQLKGNRNQMILVLSAFSMILIVLAFIFRPYWGLSKLGETPAWLFLCSAITILALLAVYWVADVWGKAKAFDFIKPAGTDTLLCYLIPYFSYSFMATAGLHVPAFALTGVAGLVKSFLFALLCAWIAGALSKRGVKLKL